MTGPMVIKEASTQATLFVANGCDDNMPRRIEPARQIEAKLGGKIERTHILHAMNGNHGMSTI